MLVMPAFQPSDPVVLVIKVKSDDPTVYGHGGSAVAIPLQLTAPCLHCLSTSSPLTKPNGPWNPTRSPTRIQPEVAASFDGAIEPRRIGVGDSAQAYFTDFKAGLPARNLSFVRRHCADYRRRERSDRR